MFLETNFNTYKKLKVIDEGIREAEKDIVKIYKAHDKTDETINKVLTVTDTQAKHSLNRAERTLKIQEEM